MVGAITFMLMLLIGATYAFFQISVKNNTTEANINLHTGELNNVALQQGVSSLHIKLSAEDMSTSNTGEYYAVTDDTNYSKTMNTVTIASIKTEGTIKDTCSGEIVISISEDMADALQLGDAILYIKGGDIEKTIDLTEITNEGTKSKTYTAYFDIDTTKGTTQNIQAWLKVVNKSDEPQNYLAGLTLNLTININNFKCGVEKQREKSETELVLEQNASGQIEPEENRLERCDENEENCDPLRRFQGQATDVQNNYICLGSNKAEDCVFAEKEGVEKDTAASNSDKYAYRIIGIMIEDDPNTEGNQTGQIKVIKKEALDIAYKWHNTTGTSYTWGYPADLNTGINGAYFLTSDTYKLNTQVGTTGKTWAEDVIAPHTWPFADVPNLSTGYDASTNAQTLYTREVGLWTTGDNHGTKDNKIGLMYVSDYPLATSNSALCHYNASSTEYAKCKASWIHLSNNDTSDPGGGWEWTMSRDNSSSAWGVYSGGGVDGYSGLYNTYSVRPVFYLQSTVQLTGAGTETDPYRITAV